jgi:hypothetical protein
LKAWGRPTVEEEVVDRVFGTLTYVNNNNKGGRRKRWWRTRATLWARRGRALQGAGVSTILTVMSLTRVA